MTLIAARGGLGVGRAELEVRPSAEEPPRSRVRLDSLTGLRFLAAALVVVHHSVVNDVHHTGLTTIPLLRPLATVGYTGVAFFFVLSGFVLAWSWQPERSKRDFWVRRVARVYPLHVVTWLIAIPVAIYAATGLSRGSSLASLFLLQAWSPDSNVAFAMNSPSWSLSCEAFFYALFPVLIWWARGRSVRILLTGCLVALAALVAAPAAAYVLSGRDAVAIFYYFPAYRVGEFFIGVCLARAVLAGWRPRLPLWLGQTAVVVALAGTMAANAAYAHVVSGSTALPRTAAALLMLPAYALVILAAALHDVSGRSSWVSSRVMVRLGTWSFALYLTHLLALETLGVAWAGWRPTTAWASWGEEISLLVVCVALSAAAYRWVEQPLERWVRTRFADG